MSTDRTTETLTAGLRAWGRGYYPIEAAAELLIRTCRGRLLSGPWIGTTDDGGVWFDADTAAEPAPLLSSGEQRVLHVAASLAGGGKVDLEAVVSGLDRDTLAVVLAALAHAGGSHQHTGLVPDPDGPWTIHDGGHIGGHDEGPDSGQPGTRVALHRLGSLYPWPACTKDSHPATTEGGQDTAPDTACQEGDAR